MAPFWKEHRKFQAGSRQQAFGARLPSANSSPVTLRATVDETGQRYGNPSSALSGCRVKRVRCQTTPSKRDGSI